MPSLIPLLTKSLLQVWGTFLHNWPFLLVSVVIAVALKLYLDPQKVAAFLNRYRRMGVVGATAAAVGTPLCSCGTTAIILGMMASYMPWAPIVAFMASSPLSSPEGLVYSAGLFGWPFALAYFATSILVGLLGGLAADFMDKRGWLKNQARFAAPAGLAGGNGRGTGVDSQIRDHPSNPVPLQAPRISALTLRQVRLSPVALATGSMGALSMNAASCCAAVPAVVETTCGCGSTAAQAVPASAVTAVSATACHTPVKPVESTCGCGAAPAVSPITGHIPVSPVESACGCGSPAVQPAIQPRPAACSCSGSTVPGTASQPQSTAVHPKVTPRLFLAEAVSVTKRLVPMFFGFAFIGYVLNGLIPAAWVASVFGEGNVYSVPLAATLGLPLYINSEASLPLVRALIEGGMSQGAAMAFLITGSGTSMGAIAGALTIARWRVLALVIATLWVGAVLAGYLYNIVL